MIAAINKVIDKLEGFVMIVFMFVATITAIVQVIARYVFNNSLFWSEEVILYTLISMSFLAGSMGVRYGAHIAVEVLTAFAGPRLTKFLQIVSSILGILFAISLFYYGGRLFINTTAMGQLSPAMRIPVGYIYSIIPISGFFIFMRYLWILSSLVLNKEYKSLTTDISST